MSSLSPSPDSSTGSDSREHERLFSAFLDEIGAGDRKRRTDFLSLCRDVEEKFDVAQAERRAQLRSLDLSLRAEAKEVHNSLLERAAAAETERDRLSAECLSASSALGLQFAQIGDRYATIIERLQCKVDMAQTMGLYTGQFDQSTCCIYQTLSKSESHLWARKTEPLDFDQPLDPHVPVHVLATEHNIHTGAGDEQSIHGASTMDQHSHLRPDTDILARLVDGLVVPPAGMDPPFMQQIWLRRQEELHSRDTLRKWGHDFDALQSDLQSRFFAVLPQGSTTSTDLTPSTLMIISLRWRTADARRVARLKHLWATSMQELDGLVFRRNKALTSKLLPWLDDAPGVGITTHSLSSGDGTPRPRKIFLSRFPIGGSLPVLPIKTPTQKEVEDAFQQTLSILRVESDRRERKRQEEYESLIPQWESRAAQAERRRQSLFDDAIDRLRAVSQRQISDLAIAGEQLALDLELAFIAVQSSREDAMRLALQSLDQQLQDAAEDALRIIEAAISNITPETQ
ncbi:hypothetical protein EXIGLDRAFT_753702 [Exidia glandulosa HHB12029]|uniref:Uncharacterized protein n=1 Tax=Exidia glandulosa HHB12029 TaxID=1314781 RepID=A0A165DJN2_EXIGL|nr:hypothetical protein EXIGLDRAFT_753702 [Exidia glandulosa HHB12029]